MTVASKVTPNCKYSNTSNYWAPLTNDDDNDGDNNQAASVKQAQHSNFKTLLNAWYRQRLGLPAKPEITLSAMVVDSGATSHFMRLEENLPVHGPSHKIVSLPDGSRIKASHTTELPFPALSEPARHAHVLPNLTTNSLISVPKLADAGYTTVFHPHGGGDLSHLSLNGSEEE